MGDADAELVGRWAAGDPGALEALYRRHVERVWRYGWLRTHSREAAAEIVQETFLRVARSAGGFEGRSSFATWLFAVARSVAIEQARRDRPLRQAGERSGIIRLVPAADDAAHRMDGEQRRAVRRAITSLPPAQRDAIVLCELAGWKIRQAAEVLGWSESRVKVTLFRARRRLRDMLKEFLAEELGGAQIGASR